MAESFDTLRQMFETNMRQRAAEMDRLQRGGQPGQPPTPGQPGGPPTTEQLTQDLPKYLQALTGGAMSTRAIYRVDTKTQEQIMKEQLKAQQETNRLLSLGGGIP
jgi:hypothetical protein